MFDLVDQRNKARLSAAESSSTRREVEEWSNKATISSLTPAPREGVGVGKGVAGASEGVIPFGGMGGGGGECRGILVTGDAGIGRLACNGACIMSRVLARSSLSKNNPELAHIECV